MGHGAVGVVADRTREILHVDPDAIDPAPALLTRGDGDAEITSICRLESGRRLVAVLSPDRLFRSDLVRRVLSEQTGDGEARTPNGWRMPWPTSNSSSFGSATRSMDCRSRRSTRSRGRPSSITRLPKAPAFIDGVMNLRGGVVPIVDLRRRFDVATEGTGSDPAHSRLGGRWRARPGFMVDGVSEVLKHSPRLRSARHPRYRRSRCG